MNSTPCAILLAGGRGTRISHLQPNAPKPMIPIGGRPFIEWVIRHFQSQGVRRFVVSLGHLAEVAEAHFRERRADGSAIDTVRETEPLGTGGGFLFAAQAAGDADPLLLANGDSLALADLTGVWKLLEDPAVDGVVVGLEVDDAARYGGLEVDQAGRLLRFREKQPGGRLINAGVYCFRRRVLASFPRKTPLSMELDVFPAILRQGARLMVHVCSAPFLDIGTPESLGEAESFVAKHWPRQNLATVLK
ncbi:MAG TPA: sugar phosphate nucleotidyltransferase [Pirellulales bacterium]|nr:sugar phosphate nucleotidyltransferase [Pirellulales bacterium]